ncbi:MAG TPA: prenyltransferase/squalene oxidase repeat-containing protein [Solirubrobacterales bacterium]|nr:prenyltransferase/squalene oxidase repeat-containing protein [Solirubrobacterales bacterium]
MSWELTSFLILGAVLLAGFAWYERSRPPSQVVALVAALAALAIAGRIAFAAFPNVKPTTDIVIFAGYALGGAPGFAVGALAALVSNFWFGQGPWTPWQMAGWGLCGILGAALALGGRNVGRLTLAASCGAAGILYGALLNFSLMATYGGDLSWERFIVFEGRAVPFDAAHAIGNIVFALIAGPAMVRMLIRFRERFEWGRRGEVPARLTPGLGGSGIAALLLVALTVGALATPAPAQADEVSGATTWLLSQQNADGGFGASPGDDSGAEITCWAMLGLEAAGRNPLDVSRAGRTPVDFLRDSIAELKSPGDLARTIVALDGAGVDPRQFGGQNLVSKLLGKRRKDGSYEDWPNSTAFAVIALRAAGATGGLDKTLAWLRDVQNDDGGWGDTPGSPSTADGTGAVLQALSKGSKASHRGLLYLGKAQRNGGGFALGGNGEVNSQSTAWAIQGILAAGEDPDSFRRGGASAPEYLAARQDTDGHFRYSKSRNQTPIWVTGEVLVAAADKYFPISPPPRQPKPSQTSSTNAGGIAPSPGVPLPGFESSGVSPNESASGGGGTPPGHSAKSGQSVSGAKPATGPPGAASGKGATAAAPESAGSSDSTSTSVTEPETTDGGSAVVAILLGLAAGALLFGAAWAARRGWMRWRYGL